MIEGLCEYPARAREGPSICLQQIADGLDVAFEKAGVLPAEISVVGLDTPGPSSATGVLSARGSTNFVHPDWAGFDIRAGLEEKLGKPVIYLNDGNAGALWGHFVIFGAKSPATSVSAIVGTGLGGGIIIEGNVVLIPYQSIRGIEGLIPECNCGRIGDLESLCSLTAIEKTLLPYFLKKDPEHDLAKLGDLRKASKLVRGLAERGDELALEIFRVQANALGVFFDEMINTFDPDALIVGGGIIETTDELQTWIIQEIRAGMPKQRVEQADIPIHIMPDGDTAGARGAAIEALMVARQTGLITV